MNATLPSRGIASVVDFEMPLPYSEASFRRLVGEYPDLRMELTADGELVIMPPTFSESGRRNFKISAQLGPWTLADGTGEGFDSNTGFRLPNGAIKSADAAWVEKTRWQALPVLAREEDFAPLAPDFVLELRSNTDRLSALQKKMREYIENGVRLGWLIDPRFRRVEIYRMGQEVELAQNPTAISGEDVLPGFTLYLSEIWG